MQAWLHSQPIDLGVVHADAAGIASVRFTVPNTLATVNHTVELIGLTSGVTATVGFVVSAGPPPITTQPTAPGTNGTSRPTEQQIAYTGSPTWQLLAVGGLLVLLGLWLRAAARRSANPGRHTGSGPRH